MRHIAPISCSDSFPFLFVLLLLLLIIIIIISHRCCCVVAHSVDVAHFIQPLCDDLILFEYMRARHTRATQCRPISVFVVTLSLTQSNKKWKCLEILKRVSLRGAHITPHSTIRSASRNCAAWWLICYANSCLPDKTQWQTNDAMSVLGRTAKI